MQWLRMKSSVCVWVTRHYATGLSAVPVLTILLMVGGVKIRKKLQFIIKINENLSPA